MNNIIESIWEEIELWVLENHDYFEIIRVDNNYMMIKKMKKWLKWHNPFKPFHYAYCPKCGDDTMRKNGQGFFRCIKCKARFIILITKEEE